MINIFNWQVDHSVKKPRKNAIHWYKSCIQRLSGNSKKQKTKTTLNVELSNLVFLKTYTTEFDEIIITFTDQNGGPLETEDKVKLTLLINK